MHRKSQLARVVIADDSAITLAFLERLLEEDPAIHIIGRANDGVELLGLPELAIAHVVVLDMLMPELGGMSVLTRLARTRSIIAVSAADQGVEREAKALGAVAFFRKQDLGKDIEAQRLRREVKRAAGIHEGARAQKPTDSVVCVVGSTGAIPTLRQLVSELENTGVTIVVVQHIAVGRDGLLPELLGTGDVTARVARHGDRLSGQVIVAPSEQHVELDPHGCILLSNGPPRNGHRPSGDVLLESVSRLGPRAIGVVLSGLGNDGAEGLRELALRGGTSLVQAPTDCPAPFMPRAALAASRQVRSVPAKALGAAVRRAIRDGAA